MKRHRLRRVRTRTFRGCLTCRSRRVKCSEERPQCRNCSRRGEICSYGSSLHWLRAVLPDGDYPSQEEPEKVENKTGKLRRDLYSVDDRLAMTLEMARPFSALRLNDDLDEAISNLDGSTSQFPLLSTTIGPFGAFSLEPTHHIETVSDPIVHNPPSYNAVTSSHSVVEPSSPWRPCSRFLDEGTHIRTQHETSMEDIFDEPGAVSHIEMLMAIFSRHGAKRLNASISWEVPAETDFLLNHYSSHVVHLLLPVPILPSPWSTLFMERCLAALGADDFFDPENYSGNSLLYGTLAVAAFHVDAVFHKPESNSEKEDPASRLHASGSTDSSSNWHVVGTKCRDTAFICLQKKMQSNQLKNWLGEDAINHALTLVMLVVAGSITGEKKNIHQYLQLGKYLVRKTSLSKDGSAEELSALRCIFSYLCTVEAVSCIILETRPFGDDHGHTRIIQGSYMPEHQSAIICSDPDDLGAPGEPDCQLPFIKLFGISQALVDLISRTTVLGNELDEFHNSYSNHTTLAAFNVRISTLEHEILHLTTIPPIPSYDNIHDSQAVSETERLSNALASAFHAALKVYFFRRIHNTNPILLQDFVQTSFRHLNLHHEIKEEAFIDAGFMLWPAFIAGCEAMDDEMQQSAVEYLRRIERCGFRNAAAAEAVMQGVWAKRKQRLDNGEIPIYESFHHYISIWEAAEDGHNTGIGSLILI